MVENILLRRRSYTAIALGGALALPMPLLKEAAFGTLMVLCGLATAFFTYFGARLVYATITFRGEGSLGHVGMYIATGLYPLLAFFFAGCTYLAWRSMRRVRRNLPPA